MKNQGKVEAILWNIAMPGFSQLLSGQLIKGLFFIVSEMLINMKSNFNVVIMSSFLWEIDRAISMANYQWLMFYPCFYMFSLWDAYRYSMPDMEKWSFLPFVCSAFFITVGLMLSPRLKIFGILLGPVFLPILFLIPGLLIGFILRRLIIKSSEKRT
ncbi:hypothetical protein [Bacillus sp. 1NLA3E]|uniref:hypothetical protein n=1 Tax=Bacillus sp. 1NLA3E TaxID=666686 RepID=UPI0003280397|nr:hypothetical protein [Bacillus sp. 1NLA3E]AGK52798.1 hypothetical protein B1NLA3E_05140 [Bacillus sp. 1NLA3E]